MPKQYSADFRDRAVRLVNDRLMDDRGITEYQAIREIAPKSGIATETLRWCCRDAEV